jgi:guanyl-specific ribonuclease Sa
MRLTRLVSPRRRPGNRIAIRGFGLAAIACVAAVLIGGACAWALEQTPNPVTSAAASASASAAASATAPLASPNLGGAEQKVLAVLDVIDRTGEAPAGYRGGTRFMNDGRAGGQILPRRDAYGDVIAYREWDVNPYTGANRGAERLVTGSDKSAWYTSDHYNSFVRIR